MKESTALYLKTLDEVLQREKNFVIASGQKKYMRDKFSFFGIPSPQRKELTRPFLRKDQLPSVVELPSVVHHLWDQPEREYQYFAMDLAAKYSRHATLQDIELFNFMVANKSWWDTVDFIASNLLGDYFKKFPEERWSVVNDWIVSGNMWLQRSAIIFQLKYKADLDKELLAYAIESMLGSSEIFINKAIGWSLRNYARVDEDWVMDFVESHNLSNLSRREALKSM